MYDAIIVLANLMDEFGNLNDETLARLATAHQLLMANDSSVLVPCGWSYRDDSDICIADAMARHAKRMGVADERIVPEIASRDTVGDAIFTKRNLANRLFWKKIIVVTSAYHVERTREIFSFVYGAPIEVCPSPSDDNDALRKSEANSTEAFRKTFLGVRAGDDAAILRRLATSHPFYNGSVYPLIEY